MSCIHKAHRAFTPLGRSSQVRLASSLVKDASR